MNTPQTSGFTPQKTWGRNSRAVRWVFGSGLAVMAALALVLLFLLNQATNNRDLYEQNYQRLFVLNVVVAGLLFLAICWIGLRLIVRLRQKKFGSRLLVRLAAVFALAGFAPGLLIYFVSYQFVSRSIETWFDVKVEGALDAGLNLGRSTLESMASDLAEKSRLASSQLTDGGGTGGPLGLERLREQLGASNLVLWSGTGQALITAGPSRFQLNPERPTTAQFRSARNQRGVTWIEGLEEASVPSPARIQAMVALVSSRIEFQGEQRFLQVTQDLPSALVANALAVTQAHREYQERALARNGLKRMYIGTLTLSLFLAVFGAVLLAILIGNRIARPLLLLADGVRQVAAGDLTPKVALRSGDELSGLTRSFADMTQQLADARQAVDYSLEEVNAARSNLQTILDNLTAGVIVLDQQGLIVSCNPGATRILRAPLAAFIGRPLSAVGSLESFAGDVQNQFKHFHTDVSAHGLDHWQQSFELGNPGSNIVGPAAQDSVTLVARGAEMPGGNRLLVFDDISEIVSAQRSIAWGEVARRLAHEIKNPLTPIQLSAERLQMKLDGKVGPAEQTILTKSVRTIVEQVDAMKRLVNEFRDYARLPAADLRPVDLNQLISEVVQLYLPENAKVPVRLELDPQSPHILGDAQQLRQVIHNLLQNAQDANAATNAQFPVVLKTQWNAQSARFRLTVLDQGPGFADHILARAFEPYVTTKTKGTGLGLAVVKKIADEHGSRIDISNRNLDGKIAGAQVSLSFNTIATTQSAEQSDDVEKPFWGNS